MHTNLIILAGGASSRMKNSKFSSNLNEDEIGQANKRSKGLITVGNQNTPLFDYVLHNAKRAGYTTIYIIVGEQATLFKEHFGVNKNENDFNGLQVFFATQYIPKDRIKPFGTADALWQALEQYPALKEESFTVCNSDNLYSYEVLKALRMTKSPNALISYDRDALEFSFDKISRFALVKLDSHNFLKDIIEKPASEKVDLFKDSDGKFRVSMNIFKFNGSYMYPYLKNCPIHAERNEKEIPTALLQMITANPNSVIGIPFSEHVPDLTAKDDIHSIKSYIEEHYPSLDWDI